MKFVVLSKEEFTSFAEKAKGKCYLQSTGVAELREKNGWESHFLGVKEKDEILAATLLLAKKRKIKKEFYAIRGPLVDFEKEELLTFFVTHLKEYVKNNDGYILRIDPYIEAISRDKDGNETGKFDYSFLKKNLSKLGFVEQVVKEMGDTIQAKFMYVIDLKETLDDVMKEMDSKTRQMIRKNEKMGIVIRKGTEKDIPLFADIMDDTGARRHFKDRGLTFYQDMYDSLRKDDMISFVFAELDISLALSKIEEERVAIEKSRVDREEKRKKGSCNEKKARIKEQEEEKTLQKLKKKEEELFNLEKEYGKKITLGGILYILYGDEVASVFGGCYEKFKEYQPFYTIHYEMIKYAVEHHYKRYNFYAINNHLDKEDSQYGIYQFKRSFGGHVIEFLGEFVLPIDKKVYALDKMKKELKKKIKK